MRSYSNIYHAKMIDQNSVFLRVGDYTKIEDFTQIDEQLDLDCSQRLIVEGGSVFGDHTRFSSYCTFGAGCSFGDVCTFGINTEFGNNCTFGQLTGIGDYTTFKNGCRFGDRTSFGCNVNVGEHAFFGRYCSFGDNFGIAPAGAVIEGEHPLKNSIVSFLKMNVGGMQPTNVLYAFNCESGVLLRIGPHILYEQQLDEYVDRGDILVEEVNRMQPFLALAHQTFRRIESE